MNHFKLYERLPDSITVDGKRYKCNFDFRNVLRMLDIMQREDIMLEARDYLCAKCVCNAPKDARNVYNELCNVLFEKTPEQAQEDRITSFEQDAELIRVAFRQVYRIDLYRDKLTWFEFIECLHNLPDGNKYEDVIGIRARPMPAPTKYNAKEREWLLKAKQSVALHLNEREAEKKYDSDVGRIFSGLMNMIPKEVTNNGE